MPEPPPDPGLRTGLGIDVHPFADGADGAEGADSPDVADGRAGTGRRLVLCGVVLEGEVPLEGHSDADVVLHAIADAVLGAAALGDLGSRFGTADPAWEGAPSRRFVEVALALAAEAGWGLVNVDATVVGERPRVGPHRDAIRASVAAICGVPAERVSVKATTTDRLGALGRGEGVAALAAVLLVRTL